MKALVSLIPVALASTVLAAGGAGPFQDAALVPPDVRLYVQVSDGAGLRAVIGERPIRHGLAGLVVEGEIGEAWRRLAETCEEDPLRLFDAWLGRRATLVVRGVGEAAEWAVLCEIEPVQGTRLLHSLGPIALGPHGEIGLFRVPDQELLVGRVGERFLIGPVDRAGLFEEIAGNLRSAPESALQALPAIEQGRGLGPGQVGVFVRHEPPLGGWSVAVAAVEGGSVSVRHAARFDASPFGREVTGLTMDLSLIDRLESSAILAYVEPTGGGGRVDAFLTAVLGRPLIGPELAGILGLRRITVLGDLEGRLAEQPVDALVPTVARAWEVVDAARAWERMDRNVIELLEAAAFEAGQPDLIEITRPESFASGRPRCVDIGPAMRRLVGDLPGAEDVKLCWAVVEEEGSGRPWCVAASSPGHLEDVCRALAARRASRVQPPGPWAHCGIADGRRLGALLASLGGGVPGEGGATALREALLLLADLANGIDRCRWRMAIPSEGEVRLEAEVDLAPPESG